MADEGLIIVFTKAPIPGQVKTRLIPALGELGAAMLHMALTERVVATAVESGLDVEIACAPDCSHAFFADCTEEFGVTLAPQLADADLGARMYAAFAAAHATYRVVIIVGGDCPALGLGQIARARVALLTRDVVLSPVEDGGYALIGARRSSPVMFDGIDWGTDRVLVQQRAALAKAGFSWIEQDPLWDVDRPEDLARVKALHPPLEFFWPE